jgi:hypothetical protein
VIGAFNSVYDALKGFFSRSFWFATFLPVALFAALHLLVAALTLRSITVFGISLNLDKENQLATAGPAIVVILVIVGYALQPLMPRLRGLVCAVCLTAPCFPPACTIGCAGSAWSRPTRCACASPPPVPI